MAVLALKAELLLSDFLKIYPSDGEIIVVKFEILEFISYAGIFKS